MKVEDRGVTDITHFSNSTNCTLPGHLSCGSWQILVKVLVQTKQNICMLNIATLKHFSDVRLQLVFVLELQNKAFAVPDSEK